MFPLISLVTSIKDYVEIVHKFLETDPSLKITTYYDFGSILTFIILSGKDLISNILTFQWLQKFWSIPILIPDIASAMISEISIFDGYFQNSQILLENPISYGNQNFFIYCIEKFMIGLLNSIFLCFPTSIAHIITLRRFVMQGLEAGFISGLGTIAGNFVWIASIIFGLRFVVIPWLSLDLFRYFLGFLLIVKYMWDSYTERKMVLEDLSKYKIFFLTFLLSFTEQTTIYPFLSNIGIGSDSTMLESFATNNFYEFGMVHFCYLLGILIGSLSLLQFTCWFWENPAFQMYMWFISSFKTTTNIYSKLINLFFLYLTMICAISNIAYFGLDYTLTNPLGFVHEDRLLEQKNLLETAFLNTKASDRNTRRNRGRHGRRERWKRRVRRYRTFDASLYDQGVYDLLTLEDLNYGFDRFWLRRKMRNHRVRFRFFPGPWMRSFKKQLSRPRLESFMGPRVEFFRILFEQAYHPEFHEFSKGRTNTSPLKFKNNILKNENLKKMEKEQIFSNLQNFNSIYWNSVSNKKQKNFQEKSTLRKFVRKVNTRIKVAKIENQLKHSQNLELDLKNSEHLTFPLFSKSWQFFSKMENSKLLNSEKSQQNFLWQRFYKKIFFNNKRNGKDLSFLNMENEKQNRTENEWSFQNSREKSFQKHFSKKERFLERYKTFLMEKSKNRTNQNPFEKINTTTSLSPFFASATAISKPVSKFSIDISNSSNSSFLLEKNEETDRKNLGNIQNTSQYKPMTLLHPLKFYVQKEQAFKKKFQFYGVKLFRNFGVENNAPYFRIMMKKFFYHYKPSLRWERTLRVATNRKARRKNSRIPRKLNVSKNAQLYASDFQQESKNNQTDVYASLITKPTHFYSLVDKRASRYRYQISKDVFQHWYYSPFNRFLLKIDVDSFIRRQPNSYFLPKNDEKLLHLKRQLFSEYYETLRWYTYMQHYSTMKNQIGGTKSLANRAYNQQFAGTFKKIRHLFNITPSFTDTTVLKFDQPLYNEYTNTKNSQIFNTSIVHEELFSDDFLFSDHMNNSSFKPDFSLNSSPQDFPNQSAKILREYLTIASPIRQKYIEKLLNEKNYWELTKFFFKGQKMRGTTPVTNQTEFLNQEKDYLFNTMDTNWTQKNRSFTRKLDTPPIKQEIWISLLKKCANKIYDQESLKNYVSLKKEKYENQKQKHQKYLKKRLERMKESFEKNVFQAHFPNGKMSEKNAILQFENFTGYTSSIQKAMKESLVWDSFSSSSFETPKNFFRKNLKPQKINIRHNRSNLHKTLDVLNFETSGPASKINKNKIETTVFSQNLRNSLKKRILEFSQTENQFQQNFSKYSPKKKQLNSFNKTQWQSRKHSILYEPLKSFKNFLWKIFKPVSFFEIKHSQQFQTYRFQYFLSKVSGSQKNLEFWKKRENALSKRKKIRKTFKRLRNQKSGTEKIRFETNDFSIALDSKNAKKPSRQKSDTLGSENSKTNRLFKKQRLSSSKSWNKYYSFENPDTNEFLKKTNTPNNEKFSFDRFFDFFSKKFQKKRSRLRRYSSFKGRGPIKKRTLREKLKRQFKSLKKYGTSGVSTNQSQIEREKKKVELIQFITERNYEANGRFLKRDQKQRRTRQLKHRVWKKKKQNFAQKRRKFRKRRRSTVSKIRVFNKKLRRILSKKQIQTWWWQTFFPTFQKTAEKTWQLEKNKQIQQQLFDLSEKEILERDQLNNNHSNFLQIGDQDFRPLAIPEAFRIREELVQKEILRFQNPSTKSLNASTSIEPISEFSSAFQEKKNREKRKSQNFQNTNDEQSFSMFEKLTKNITNSPSKNISNAKLFVGTNPSPFYAGWDNNLRKFMITNRLLSRKGCFSCSSQLTKTFFNDQKISENISSVEKQHAQGLRDTPQEVHKSEFSKAPLQGMNAATTLYWQIPFTTYDPDQFFALGMDGFSPLGWRYFSFKHSKQTTKPILVRNFLSFQQTQKKNFSKNIQSNSKNEIQKNFEYRRVLKKQKRIKKHPRPPVWFPSGSLSQQVLPVHYIYVFYKRSRLPRDRYIRRRLRSTFSQNSSSSSQTSLFTKITDFTLRKRAKPRRKYHRKRFLLESHQFLLRRRKFRGFFDEKETNRPSSKIFQTFSGGVANTKQEKRTVQFKQRKKILDSKQSSENLRVRQLRRRVQRQVFRPVWRYRPRSGGFVWPGDYLRLELVKAPQLKIPNLSGVNKISDSSSNVAELSSSRKIRKKKRRALQEWQIQPKKYLLEKHNLKVLKKRYEKSGNIFM